MTFESTARSTVEDVDTTEAASGSYRIAQLARLTGFTATTLRFYEDAGVLPPPERTAAGYRIYDDRAVERLRLVARAKELGCTLDDIAGLVEAWDADQCGPVKHRLHALVDAKLAAVERHIADQVAFAAQLQETAASLEGRPVEGPCHDGCGCIGAVPEDGDAVSEHGCSQSPPAIACSLAAADVGARIDQWQAVLASVERREVVPQGVRLAFGPSAPLADIASLTSAEQECCPFFAFAITIDGRGVALEVTAPAEGREVLEAVFGAAT